MFQNRLDQFHDTFFNSEYFYMDVNWASAQVLLFYNHDGTSTTALTRVNLKLLE